MLAGRGRGWSGRPWLGRRMGAIVALTVVVGAAATACDGGAPPAIDIWYGDVQDVGAYGRTQRWANVLGRVTDPDDTVASLTYTLNGGAELPLTIGQGGNPRLARSGDFNVEIDRDDLAPGDNTVVVTAHDEAGHRKDHTVTLRNTPGTTWPLPTRVDWNGISLPSQAVDVVDGLWSASASGAQVVESGYDRVLAVGDQTWTDYEVEVPVTIHAMDRNEGGVGFLMRWTGHTEEPPHIPGKQPRIGWRPSGGLAWYRVRYSSPAHLVVATDNEVPLAEDWSGFTLSPGTTYTFRASVERTTEGDEYRLTVFPAGQPESSGVSLTGLDTAFTKDAGSVLLLAHRAKVTFGDITVTEIGGEPPPPPPPPPNQAPVAVDDGVSTAVDTPVLADVLANDSDVDGSIVPSSVAVANGPTSGTASVDPVSGTVTYTPDAGFVGTDTFTYTVDDDDGATSNPATVTVQVQDIAPPPPSGLVSDEFLSPGLGEHWSWFDPLGDGTATATGSHAALSVPAGTSHDLWPGRLNAPRLLQDSANVDLEIETKIDSPVTSRYQLQGLVVQQDEEDLIRAEIHHDGTNTRLFAATISGSQAIVRGNLAVTYTAPYWLRLTRTGDQWTFQASDNGTTWATIATFNHALTVNQAGIFTGNHTPSPQHTATIDYFRAAGAPVASPPGNEAPVAVEDAVSTVLDTPVAVDVLANDADVDGSIVPSSVAIANGPTNGTATADPETAEVSYAPDAGFVGTDTFTYTVDDDDGAASNPTTVTVQVQDVAPPPSSEQLVSDD
jgi:regulation of enolase protein 1 (concanavalin A-like superfamily)